MRDPLVQLDEYCSSIGITPTPWGFRGRKCEGSYQGRSVLILCYPTRRTKYAGEVRYFQYTGHRFEIRVSTPLCARIVIAPAKLCSSFTRWLNKKFGLLRQEALPPALETTEIWSLEPDWTARLLSNHEVVSTLQALFPADSNSRNSLHFSPERIGISEKRTLVEASPEWLESSLNALLCISNCAEKLPRPQIVAVRKGWETWLDEHPVQAALALLAGMFLIVILATLLIFGPIIGFLIWFAR